MLLCRVERLTAGLATRIDHVRKLAAAAVTLEDVGPFHFACVDAAPTFAHAKARASQALYFHRAGLWHGFCVHRLPAFALQLAARMELLRTTDRKVISCANSRCAPG